MQTPRALIAPTKDEDVLHALRSSPILTQAWDGDPQWNFRGQTSFENFPHLLSHVFESGCNAELFAMVTWTIWFRRNKVRSTPPGFPVDQVQQCAFDSLLEFRTAQPRKQPTPARPLSKWSPPAGDSYKVNFDGAVFKEDDRVGIGVIIQNCHGMVMASLSQNIPLPQTAVELEAIAARRALDFSLELGFTKAILEGESQTVMIALQDDSPSHASFGLLILMLIKMPICLLVLVFYILLEMTIL